jgi:uncharacterized integral membrane protein
MRGVRRVGLLLVVVIAGLATVGFVLENQEGVSLSLFGWVSAQLPVAVFVVTALIVGMVIGPILRGLFFYRGDKRQVRK